MKLYNIIDLVSKDIDPENPGRVAEYLKGCLDDNKDLLRSRFCKRHEGDIPDRELGDIKYVVYGTSRDYVPSQELYIQAHKIDNVSNLPIQILWGEKKDYIEEDIAICKQLDFEHHSTILI